MAVVGTFIKHLGFPNYGDKFAKELVTLQVCDSICYIIINLLFKFIIAFVFDSFLLGLCAYYIFFQAFA